MHHGARQGFVHRAAEEPLARRPLPMQTEPMDVLRSAGWYFLQVFAAGFVLGVVRVPWLVPRLGERTAELLELPLMVLLIAWVSRRRVARTPSFAPRRQLGVGIAALVMMVFAEFALGLASGRTPLQVALDRDPVSGVAYALALVLFASLPWWWARLRPCGSPGSCRGSPPPPGSPGAAPRARRPAAP